MNSEITIVYKTDRRSAAELNAAVRAAETPYVLFTAGEETPDENTREVLLEALQAENAAAAVGRVKGTGKDRVYTVLLKADYPKQASVKDIHTLYREGKADIFLNTNQLTLYKKSVFESIGYFDPDPFCTEAAVWTAKALYGGYRIAYVPEVVADVPGKTGLFHEFRKFFLIGASEKTNIQYFGYNIPMEGCRIPGDASPVVWPDTDMYIAGRTAEARKILKEKSAHFSVLRLTLLKTAMKLGNLLGRKHLYLPEHLAKHYLKLERKSGN